MSNPNEMARMLPPAVRFWIYSVYGLGSVVVTYLAAKHVITLDEVTLWTGLGTVIGATSASNVNRRTKHTEPRASRRVRRATRNRGG